MATKNIIPRNNNEGKIGTNSKKWSEGHFESLSVAGQSVTGGGATALNGLTDVTISNVQNNQVLKYNGSNWVNAAAPETLNSTSDLSEGSSNLYFTNERVDDRVNALITTGTGISKTYNDSSNTLTLASDATLQEVINSGATSTVGVSIAKTGIGLTSTGSSGTGYISTQGSSNYNLSLDPQGSGIVVITGNTGSSSRGSGQIKINNQNNSYGVVIKSPLSNVLTADYTLTLPANTGNVDQVLKTDGNGVLSWVDQTSGGGGSSDFISEGQAKVETIDTGTDARIEFYVDPDDNGTASKAWEITENGHLLPGSHDTFDIGSPLYKVRDLYVSDNSLWLGDDHKMSIRAGKISHKKRKKSTNYIPRAFANYLSQGSFNRDKLLAIKKTSNGGDGSGTQTDGSATNESELTLADWVRYANATQIDGQNVSNRFRSSKSGGPQEGKWTANDIFDEDDDFEEIIDPSSPTNLDLNSFSNDAKATTIDDSSPSATKFVTESAVKSHVDTKISAISLSLSDLSNVSTSGVSSGQILKYNGSSWAPAADGGGSLSLNDLTNVSAGTPSSGQVLKWDGSNWSPATDNTGGSGGGGSLPALNNITSADSGSAKNYTISNTVTGIESTFLINFVANTTINVFLPNTASVSSGYKIQIKRLTTDPVTIKRSNGTTQTIDDGSEISIPYRYSSVTLQCDGNNWYII